MILVQIIATLIIIAIIIIVFTKILGMALFGGPQYTAFKTVANEIDDLCKNGQVGDSKQFAVYLPDSTGSNAWNLRYFFIVVGKIVVTTEQSFWGSVFGGGGDEKTVGSLNSIALASRSHNEETKDKNDYVADFV